MVTFLQPVELPVRCFLQEVLFWLAFQRLPVAIYSDGKELRSSAKVGDDLWFLDWGLSSEETRRAGIPTDPRWPLDPEETVTLPLSYFDGLLALKNLNAETRSQIKQERAAAEEYQADEAAWKPQFERALELPKSEIFVALRNSSLRGKGVFLPSTAEAALFTNDVGPTLELTEIPSSFWSLQGIDFIGNQATVGADQYRHICFDTVAMLSVFPGRGEKASVERVGDTFVLPGALHTSSPKPRRGRKPYNWPAFHIKALAMLQGEEFPDKKEAAVALFQEWFLRQHGEDVSRSAISEKLKPYYDHYKQNRVQKSRK